MEGCSDEGFARKRGCREIALGRQTLYQLSYTRVRTIFLGVTPAVGLPE
jgi:hypothetical protein